MKQHHTILARITRINTAFILLCIAGSLTSCNDWLDVKSETEAKEQDLFEKKNGFKEALTGIYMTLADQDAYGEKLTMTTTEELACLWYCDDFDYNPDFYYLRRHDYQNDYAKDNLKAVYSKLFYAITQANVLLKNIEDHGEALDDDPTLKALLQGEAFAIRAYCQLDILRLFGQLPSGKGSRQVRLPYSSTTTIDEIPPYYSYEDYVTRLRQDIDNALQDLLVVDPVKDYTLSQLNYPSQVSLDDTYFYYRRSRLNFWAVLALRARLNLYVGDTESAHSDALAVINGKVSDGSPVAILNTVNDFSESSPIPSNLMAPSECLFALSKYNLYSYANTLFIGNSGTQIVPNRDLVMSQEMFNLLFQGTNTAANNRYLRQWNRTAKDNRAVVYPALLKYYRNTTNDQTSLTENLIIPMLRLSEMYLIAMETASSVSEANALYATYMRDRNVLIETDAFTTMDEVRAEVLNEYRRELIAEGQVFFTYKRLFQTSIPWQEEPMTESAYIIPLPDTEYEN
ncbi:MAG: RagB/SusD family nutrient uptake outer membrane protein [Prevotella sp.]|nr:RagB/SusD family nutrient uptake outer membrane protein [Prevotella sp.]